MAEGSYTERPLIDKLGIKPGVQVAVLGIEDATFMGELRARTDDVTLGEPLSRADAIFLGMEGPDDVRRLNELRRLIKPDGAVWAVFRKGRKDFNENDVLRLGLESGLVDVKVVRFSDTHTALKFVVRKTER